RDEESTASVRETANARHVHSSDDPNRSRYLEFMTTSLAAAIAALDPRDRLRLALYYAQDLTLAQIGRTLREHEATVSRHLSHTRAAIREDVERRLCGEHGLVPEAVAEFVWSVSS